MIFFNFAFFSQKLINFSNKFDFFYFDQKILNSFNGSFFINFNVLNFYFLT